MKKPNRKINNGLIVMTKGERAAVISLLSVIAVLLAFSVFRPAIRFAKLDEKAFHNLDSMIALQQRKDKSTPILEVQMPPEDVPTVKTSSENRKPTRDKKEPAQSTNPNKPVNYESKAIPILDINLADSLILVELPQIGEVMASRIQRYRERLGGFVSFDQLYEIKGMDSVRFATIKPFLILESNEIRKLDVNRDEFKTLLRHPYLEYEQVKAIVNYRERKGLIKNWSQLQEVVGEVNPLLEQYADY